MTTKDPLRTPDDAKGKKLRTFPNEMMRWTLDAIGFSVQIMPLPEVYMAIQQGAVSGQENPIDTIYSNKFYEVAPYVTLTKHVYSPIPLAISEKTWQKLSRLTVRRSPRPRRKRRTGPARRFRPTTTISSRRWHPRGPRSPIPPWILSGRRCSRCTARRVTSTAPPT